MYVLLRCRYGGERMFGKEVIFHVDVNAAYLSWEAVYRLKHLGGTLDLREIASAIGGDVEMRHGIILAKSMEAKKYGIKTGMSIMEARQKCQKLVLAPPNYTLYEKASRSFVKILQEYTPDVEPYSIDECYMNMTGTESLFGSPIEVANKIKNRIYTELGFTVNKRAVFLASPIDHLEGGASREKRNVNYCKLKIE